MKKGRPVAVPFRVVAPLPAASELGLQKADTKEVRLQGRRLPS